MPVVTPIPKVSISYTTDLIATNSYVINSVSLASGTLPPGLSLSRVVAGGFYYARLSGTPTTVGPYNFTINVSTNFGTSSVSYSTQVADAPLPGSGSLKWSQIRSIVGRTGAFSASNSRFRFLANGVVNTSPVKASNCRNKPVAGSVFRNIDGSQPFATPAYQVLIVKVAGAGGGGGKGIDVGGTSFCFSLGGNYNGGAGTESSSFSYIAYGGTGGIGDTGGGPTNGSPGGNNVNSSTGGGSAGGAGVSGTSGFYNPGSGPRPCPVYPGGSGGAGGYYETILSIASGTVEYGTATTVVVGNGGTGNPGTDGYVYLEWA